MSLGVKREFVGDILVRPEGADIVILKEIKEFLMMNYGRAGHTSFSLEEVPLAEILLPEQKVRYKSDTVASLRLDNVISSAFGGSRTTAASAIKGGLVFINYLQTEKPDQPVREGDILVLRGKGKAVLEEIGGKSRKDRVYIKIKIFE
jgi:RNA-binding protein YlmH